MAIMINATPIPIPASAPGESVLPDEVTLKPVELGEAELPVCDTGLRVSEAIEEEVVLVTADEEDEAELDVVGVDFDDVVDEETAFCTMLHRTVEDWLKLFGHVVNGGQQASSTLDASMAR